MWLARKKSLREDSVAAQSWRQNGQATALTFEQVNLIAAKLEEPYATLVLFLAASGLRIGEAVALKQSDFEGNLLHVTRRVCDGDEGPVKSERSVRTLPIHPELVRANASAWGCERIFCSRAETTVTPGNALKRYVRPAATGLGITIGGWHDFRHTMTPRCVLLGFIRC
jgi:integrase